MSSFYQLDFEKPVFELERQMETLELKLRTARGRQGQAPAAPTPADAYTFVPEGAEPDVAPEESRVHRCPLLGERLCAEARRLDDALDLLLGALVGGDKPGRDPGPVPCGQGELHGTRRWSR